MSDSGVTPTMPEDLEEAVAPGRGASIGRFLVLGPLGAGGMGVVLSAYDPELERKVALKLLRGDVWRGERAEAGRDALRREAQAMARLAHPNVVGVYEIAVDGGAAYMVMEQVEGRTLRAWLDEATRPWMDIVDMVLQAGEGLAAAHRAGVVHRDFKPQNVLVGGDGRPRVSDFGLASVAPGELAGTRAYMAPEQVAGERADERADQYAFCVTLWEALQGERPPASPESPRDKRAPAWMYGVLARGLAARPEDRWPSMDALLGVLRRQAPRRRLIVAAAALVVGATAFVVGRQAAMPPACSGGEGLIAPLWDDAARARVSAAFDKTGRPYAKDTFARVDAALRGRLGEWAGAHREACEASHVRHEQSETMLDLRMQCLARARAETAALVSLLANVDGPALDRATQAAVNVGDVSACSDVASLGAAFPRPRDTETAHKVEALRQDVARLAALRELGKWKEGVAEGRELVARARALAYMPLLATALVWTARFDVDAGDVDAGLEELYQAVRAASEARDDDVVAQAAAHLVFVLGVRKQRFEAAEVAYRVAAAATARAGNTAVRLARLYDYRAQLLKGRGDGFAALLLSELVVGLNAFVHGPQSVDVAFATLHLAEAMDALGLGTDAKALYARSLAATENALGPEHPSVANVLKNYGWNRVIAFDFEGAAPLLERAIALYERSHGPDHPRVAYTAYVLAIAREGQRRLPEARALIERSIRILEAKLRTEDPDLAMDYEVLGIVAHREGKPDEAHAWTQKALAIKRKAYGLDHMGTGVTYELDAGHLRALGRLGEARASMDQALAIYKKTLGEDHPDYGNALGGFGDILLAEGKPIEAIPIYERSVALVERAYGPDSIALCGPLDGLADALVDAGEARRAVPVAERAVALAAKGPPGEVEAAEFRLAKARWASGDDRPGAVALARRERAKLAALPFPSEDLPRIDRWLATRPR